ncbi:MAG: cupin domain-containing protein [Thermoleophilia bacterium]
MSGRLAVAAAVREIRAMPPFDPQAPPISIRDVEARESDRGWFGATRRRLGAAAGARAIGVSLYEVPPGRCNMPLHVHADEGEIFLVLAGAGLSLQLDGKELRAFEIAEGDALLHEAGGPAHTILAGDGGITVLALAEGSRTGITYLPRSRTFWLGDRWLPADGPSPFRAEQALGAPEIPDPSPRPQTIVATGDLPIDLTDRGRFADRARPVADALGARTLGLTLSDLPPGALSCPRHWHTLCEEAFLVTGGSGALRLGERRFPVSEGSFVVRPPSSRVPHRFEAGDAGLRMIGMSDRPLGDRCVYPDSRKVTLAPGILVRYEELDYWDGEPEA